MNTDIVKKNNNEVLISFIIPTYNSQNHIEECLKSIIGQNFNKIEIIIIDACSKDSTLKILDGYKKYVTKLISEPDGGMYFAINKGIKLSKGHIIKIINSDDLLTKDSIKSVLSIFKNKDKKISEYCILSSLYRIDKNSKILKLWKKTNRIGFFENFLHPTWYMSKEVYVRYGLYDTKYFIASDYEYFLRILKNNVTIIQSKNPLAMHREGGMSDNHTGLDEVVEIKKLYSGKFISSLLRIQLIIFRELIKLKKFVIKYFDK